MTARSLALAAIFGLTAADATAGASPRVSSRITDQGEVVVRLEVKAGEAAVRAVLSDAARSHLLAATTLAASASADGPCARVKLRTKGLMSPYEVVTRRCPTTTGWRETMLESSDFREYHNEWTIEAVSGGSVVSFRTRTMPDAAVPESLILGQTRKVLEKMMLRLAAELGEG